MPSTQLQTTLGTLALSLGLALAGPAGAQHDSHSHHGKPVEGAVTAASTSTKPAVLTRQAIPANPGEYSHVIGDMQKMLGSVQGITAALGKQDWATVHKLATALRPENTMASPDPDSVSFHKKIPDGWRAMGGPMHKGFAALGDEAANAKRGDVALQLLSNTLSQCVACHATYALKLTP